MQLVSFGHNSARGYGVLEDDRVADFSALEGMPTCLRDLLACVPDPATALARSLRKAPRLPIESVQLRAPIGNPRHFFAVGLNYRQHAAEMGQGLPERPRLFVKLPSSITGPYAPIMHPGFSDSLDYEGELCVVIGKQCRAVPRTMAHKVVAGYMVTNDVSLRELVNPDLLVLGKGCATFAPMGPWLTTADEIADPHALRIRTLVNGEPRQYAPTRDLVFNCWSLIEWISRAIELQPGDLITTGSPSGSGIGFAPPKYLKPGDRIDIAIDGLGVISNRVSMSAEAAAAAACFIDHAD